MTIQLIYLWAGITRDETDSQGIRRAGIIARIRSQGPWGDSV